MSVPYFSLEDFMLESNKGQKFDADKLRYDLLPAEFEEAVAKVLTHGAKKYAPNNWQLVENPQERYYAALRRHIAAWRMGEKIDKESGLSHLSHAATNIMFLLYFEGLENGTEK